MTRNVLIVDEYLAHNCPYTGEFYVLVLRNALKFPSMEHNLIPPFIIRTDGVEINDAPKTNCKDPEFDDHSISFDYSDLRTPFQLDSVFS